MKKQNNGTLAAPKLSELTGDSVSDLSKLSRRGYFAPAKDGLYKATDAINGWFRHYREIKDRPLLVDKDELNGLTGLGDSMHRKLAAKGYFPPPRKGLYDLRATFAGMVKYHREHLQRRNRMIDQKREAKLDRENALLDFELKSKNRKLIPVDEMVTRLTSALVPMRQRILSSSLDENERHQVIDDLGRLLDAAIGRAIPGSIAPDTTLAEKAAANNSE
jgi:hypothetical protein